MVSTENGRATAHWTMNPSWNIYCILFYFVWRGWGFSLADAVELLLLAAGREYFPANHSSTTYLWRQICWDFKMTQKFCSVFRFLGLHKQEAWRCWTCDAHFPAAHGIGTMYLIVHSIYLSTPLPYPGSVFQVGPVGCTHAFFFSFILFLIF